MEDLETSDQSVVRITPPPQLELLMEDSVSWAGVWRLPLYPQEYRLISGGDQFGSRTDENVNN